MGKQRSVENKKRLKSDAEFETNLSTLGSGPIMMNGFNCLFETYIARNNCVPNHTNVGKMGMKVYKDESTDFNLFLKEIDARNFLTWCKKLVATSTARTTAMKLEKLQRQQA